MVFRSFILMVITLFFLCTNYAQPTQLDSLTGFEFTFPSEHTCSDSTVSLDGAYIIIRTCNAQKRYPEGKVRFTMMHAIYPEMISNRKVDSFGDEFWEATISASVQAVLGDLVYKDIRVKDNYEEAVWRIAYDEGQGVVKSKAWIKDKYFVVLKVDYLYSLRHYEDIDRFIDSGSWP